MYHSELLILRNGWEEPLHPAGKTPVYNVLEAQNICFIELVMVFLKTKFMCIQLWFSITIICLLQNYATNYFVSNCLRECTPIHSFFISTWSNKPIQAFFQKNEHRAHKAFDEKNTHVKGFACRQWNIKHRNKIIKGLNMSQIKHMRKN